MLHILHMRKEKYPKKKDNNKLPFSSATCVVIPGITRFLVINKLETNYEK